MFVIDAISRIDAIVAAICSTDFVGRRPQLSSTGEAVGSPPGAAAAGRLP
jgi:hypothetical protein